MTEISEAARKRVVELWDAEPAAEHDIRKAFARYIQRVSDAAKVVRPVLEENVAYESTFLDCFILPDPVDPLYEALFEVVSMGRYDTREQCELLRGELERRGFTIAPVQP